METDLLKTLPTVLRARGFRLYLANGKRLVDLWQNGGAAVLGHTPTNMLRELKNTASRGLYAPFPHFTEDRFFKALSKLLPGRSFRLYSAPPQELIALFANADAELWRPFVDPAAPFASRNETPYLIPVLPGIQLWRDGLPMGLCIAVANSETQLMPLPKGDILSPILLAMAARGTHDLLAAPERASPKFPRITRAINKQAAYKHNIWKREGIYLTPKEKLNDGEWAALFRKFFDAGFLLPSNPAQPLILPGELSEGEETKFAELLSVSLLKPETSG